MKGSILVACFLVVSISAFLAFRIKDAPDEGNHLHMVEHYAVQLRLASWKDTQYGTHRGHAYHLFSPVPYLIYLPFAWISKHVDTASKRTVIRLGGCVYALIQFFLCLALTQQIFYSKTVSLLSALSINLIPQLRYIHGYINADSFSICAATFGIVVLFRVVQTTKFHLREGVLVGLALSLIAHAKYNTFPVGVLLLGVFLYRMVKGSEKFSFKWRSIGLALALPLVFSGWFHFWVYKELGNGHILAGKDHLALMRSTFKGEGTLEIPGAYFNEELTKRRIKELPYVWRTTWGGWRQLGSLPEWYLVSLMMAYILALFGAVFGMELSGKTICPGVSRLILFATPVLLVSTYLPLALTTELAIQGRLLLQLGAFFILFAIILNSQLLLKVGVCERWAPLIPSVFFIVMLFSGNVILLL